MLQSGSSSLGSFTGFKAHEFVAHTGKTNCVAVGQRSGQVLATGGDDKRVNVWRIGRASSIWSLTGNSSAIESLRFDPTEEFLVSGSAGGAVKLFDLSAGKMTRHFRGHMSNVTVIDSGSFDRRFVTTGSMDCQVKLWNVETKECAMAFKGHNADVTDVQFSPDGYILASAAADGQVKLWDLRAGKPMHTFQACSGAVRAIRFNPQEFLLAVATSDRTVKLYDIEFMELFCITAPDTCPTRAITFDPEGQNMYCASPSGLRRWSWDNDTASARLEAMGDVPWGKVGAGALHFNADGQQLLAASCAGSRVSVWAVDSDADHPLPSRPPPPEQQQQEQEETGGAFGADTAMAHIEAASVPPLAAAGSAASSPPDSPPQGGKEATAGKPPDPLSSNVTRAYDADAKSVSSRSSGQSRSSERAGRDEWHHNRDSKPAAQEKKRDASPIGGGNGGGVGLAFEVLGRQLPLLPTAAERKLSSSPPGNAPATAASPMPNPMVTAAPGADSNTAATASAASAAAAKNPASVVAYGSSSVANVMLNNRRSSRAAAVAATVAAVASAKAATDDAVASVSSSGRHRSIGTSISDTLVVAAHPAANGTAGREAAVGAGVDRPGGGGEGLAGSRYRASAAGAWPEPAPGKHDGSNVEDHGRDVAAALGIEAGGDRHGLLGGGSRRQGDGLAALTVGKVNVDYKWHKRVAEGFTGVDDAVDKDKQGERRMYSSGSGGGDGRNKDKSTAEASEDRMAGRRGEEGGSEGRTTASEMAVDVGATAGKLPCPWWQDSQGGFVGRGGEGGRAGEGEGDGGGEDSPPLLGSPEPARTAQLAQLTSPLTHEAKPPHLLPSSSRRSPEISRQRRPPDAVVGQSSPVGFPVRVAGTSSNHGGASAAAALSIFVSPEVRETEAIGPSAAAAAFDGLDDGDIFSKAGRSDGGGGDGDGSGGGGVGGGGVGGGGAGELGMTRPRTATRRWDRPGPPGDDEIIGKILLSRASVTSMLSSRLTHLRMLRYGWADGDVSGTISKLARLERSVTPTDDSPRAVVADFLWVVPLDGTRVTLEHCLELMPLLEGLWKLDTESCVAAATRCLESIVRRFGGFVRDTLGASVSAGGVDLAREDRIARCREAHRAFIRGYHHLERSEGEFYEDRRIAAVAGRLRPLFESYFMS